MAQGPLSHRASKHEAQGLAAQAQRQAAAAAERQRSEADQLSEQRAIEAAEAQRAQQAVAQADALMKERAAAIGRAAAAAEPNVEKPLVGAKMAQALEAQRQRGDTDAGIGFSVMTLYLSKAS